MTATRVFLADDHEVVRTGLKMLVDAQENMKVCGEAGDGQATCSGVEECRPDVVVLDVSMPLMNGAQTAVKLREQNPNVKILALTVHEDKGYLRLLLEAGVAGYMLKRSAAEALIQAIRTVAAGGTYLDPTMAAKVVTSMNRKRTGKNALEKELTNRETEVAQLVAQGFSNKEIAADLGISVKTVETHKARLMEKLGFHSRAEIVRYAGSRGWLQGL